jgi:hypothetical protein
METLDMTAVTAPSPARRERRVEGVVPERTILGVTLFAIGLVVLAGFLVAGLDRYTLIGVSTVCLLAFAATREYGYAVPAGITGGVGSMILVTSSITNDPILSGSSFFLCLAGGFLAVWLLGLVAVPRETHPWPLVPATVLGIMGLAILTQTPAAVDWLKIGIGVALATIGVVLVLRSRTRQEATPAPTA